MSDQKGVAHEPAANSVHPDTRVPDPQRPGVKSWIDEARLLIHLGEDDFRIFTAGTGPRTYEQLCTFVKRWERARRRVERAPGEASGRATIAPKLEAIVTIADVVEIPLESDVAAKPVMVPIRGEVEPAATVQAS